MQAQWYAQLQKVWRFVLTDQSNYLFKCLLNPIIVLSTKDRRLYKRLNSNSSRKTKNQIREEFVNKDQLRNERLCINICAGFRVMAMA